MADNILDLLHRRSDLSTFLVHFTRGPTADAALASLLSILHTAQIEARTAYGMARCMDGATNGTTVSQRTVCFTDTPLEHCWMMVREVAGRAMQFQPYGVAFTKRYARSRGCNPVWYIDQTPGHPWVSHAVNALVRDCSERWIASPESIDLESMDILKMTPFFEQSGEGKDFAWEREWRHRCHFDFHGPQNIMAVFAPAHRHNAIRLVFDEWGDVWATRKMPILDPVWGLERMLVTLSGVKQIPA